VFSKSILFSSNKVGAGASQVCELWENPEGAGGVVYRAEVTWHLLLSLQMYQDAESKQVLLEWMKERQEIRSVHCPACS